MNNKISELEDIAQQLEQQNNFEEKEVLSLKFYDLFIRELENINQHFLDTHSPYAKNQEITLYIDDSNKNIEEKHFFIYNNKKQNVGAIKFYGNEVKEKYIYGNVYYFINPEHRGNRYALKALKLMSSKLYSEGITELFIAAYSDNYASLKTIKNFGGIKINSSLDDKISIFKCDLKRIFHSNKTNRSR